MQDHIIVRDGKVAQVFRGAPPAGIIDAIPVGAGSASPGMGYVNGQLSGAQYTVTPDDVRREARRRIHLAYPPEKQASLSQDGGAEYATMQSQIMRLRLCSRALCRMSPIPAGFREDTYWQGDANWAAGAPQGAAGGQQAAQAVNQPGPAYPAPAAPVIHISGPPVTVTTHATNHGQAIPAPEHRSGAPYPVAQRVPPAAEILAQPPGPTPVMPPQVEAPPPFFPPASVRQHVPEAPRPQAPSVAQPAPEQPLTPRSAADAINAEAAKLMEQIWPQAREVAAEHAARALKGSNEALGLIAPLAADAGVDPAKYCEALLYERVAAHKKILAIDAVRDRALAAVAAADAPEKLTQAIETATWAFATEAASDK